jgi:beta-lactam-binding protein with PASTA domain
MQTPEPGNVAVSSGILEITFTLSGGPGFIPEVEHTVPFVEGLSISDAEAILSLSGISIANVYYVDSSEPIGTVVLQSEAPYSVITAQPGTVTIDLTVSLGPSSSPITP